MVSGKNVGKIPIFIIAIAIITPWFWFIPVPENLFNLDLKKDIQTSRDMVGWERGKIQKGPLDKFFLNWPEVIFNGRLEVVMENLDIGNYFFAGHPRERVGVKEVQKFFFFQFLLFVIGFFNGRIVKYKKFMFFYTLTALFFTFIFKWRLYDQTLVFAPIMILVMALGLEKVLSWKTPRKLLFFGFALGEFLLFRSLLMKGFLM
ncbi:hypothetical protein A3D01_06495 [Candidatus Woesebacteria bacterium RIFCSPHIGHO2_02_FULL_39_13]|uniref:Uncharacterized protein n=1 Tax=Candidatus Woesebacteria bacterium RIFCSPHIGHO2_02_FULL_39_13 TaxID=1802505 RepID=A0A1F7Z5D4_9BACT|nr:MAG: hypothetical protein A3D01_06495 [Candidatus Woesebacteria bacterium RIFCSPHIGHO2_02_FULL_39_13]